MLQTAAVSIETSFMYTDIVNAEKGPPAICQGSLFLVVIKYFMLSAS